MSENADIVRFWLEKQHAREKDVTGYLTNELNVTKAECAREKERADQAQARVEMYRVGYRDCRASNKRLWESVSSARAERDALAARVEKLIEALEIICEIGETRDVEVARAALAEDTR